MAGFTLSTSSLVLLLLSIAFFFRISISEATSLFSFTSFSKDPSFKSNIALYGDAKLVDGGSLIQLTDSASHGAGGAMYKKPIKFVETKSEFPAGWSTFFSFSSSHGGKLRFLVFPASISNNNGTFEPSLVQVEFDSNENVTKLGDSNENHVTVTVNDKITKKISNFKIVNLEDENFLLYTWIDYQASSKSIEVRLSRSESPKPVDPLIFCLLDLSEKLKDEDEFMVGMESRQRLILHSWSLEVRHVSKWMHSYALLDPDRKDVKGKGRIWDIVSCLMMTFGSTGLVFFAMMYIWTALRKKNLVMVMPEECGLKRKEFEFEYEKMEKMEVVSKKLKGQERE